MTRTTTRLIASTVLACAVLAPAAATAQPAGSAPKPSLYTRLGGYDAIAAVTDDFLGRLTSEPAFTKFFSGHSADSLTKIRQLVVDQLCAVTGGPCKYIGRDMKTAHAGLGITKADWTRSVALLTQSLDHFKVPAAEKGELLALASTLEADIVERP